MAWKYGEGANTSVCFAADSCVTVQGKDGSLEMPYSGVKVLAVPVSISPPFTNTSGQLVEPFERIFGMAFVDGILPAFLLKEVIAEALQHLQVASAPADVTFQQICDFVLKFHKHLHGQLRDHLGSDFEVSFFFGGFCPSAGRIRVAKFFVDPETEQPTYTEILLGAGVQFDTLGLPKAERRFRQLLELNLAAPPCRVHYAVWRRLREVLRDPAIPFVQGAIQFGEFIPDGNFWFSGTLDLDFVDGQPQARTFIRGTEIDLVHQSQGPGDFHVIYAYANPFNEDVQAFDPSRYLNEDGSGIVIDEPITVVPHEPAWLDWYAAERDFLLPLLGEGAVGMEHIGGTAVPRMAARPVIDILVGMKTAGEPRQPPFKRNLHQYDCVGDCKIPGRLVYRKRQDRQFDLHIVEHGGEFWNKSVKLREFLRNDPDEARDYALEKLRILNFGSWTLRRYLDKRADYLKQLIERATSC